MNKPTFIRSVTVALDAETMRLVEDLASGRGVSVEDYAAMAITIFAQDMAANDVQLGEVCNESDYRALIQEGVDAADRGDLIPHEKVMAELDAMIAKHKARCS